MDVPCGSTREMSMESWAAQEVGTAELGDPRRRRRLIALLEALAAKPGESIPTACAGRWAAIKGGYRFLASTAIEPEAILRAHRDATVSRCADASLILAIQDTTELNFTAHPQTTGLGHLRAQGQRGLLVHSVLAVSATGVPLGLLAQQQWARDPAQRVTKDRRRRPTRAKESQRWLDGETAALGALPPETAVLTIADREGDIFDYLAHPRRPHAFVLIRAAQQRGMADPETGERTTLWPTVAAQAPAGEITVELQPTRGEPRTARLVIRHAPVTLLPPHPNERTRGQQPIQVHAILAQEEAPALGQTPVVWRLLTTWPLETTDDALGMIEVYQYRWLIERFHFVLKTGCGVEALQLEQEARLERAVAVYSIVAVRILRLTYLARQEPTGDGRVELTEAEWAVLVAQMPALREEPTTRTVLRAIASLGGFIGREGDGEPGAKALWQGWRRLTDLALGWDLHHRLTSSPHPSTTCG